MSGQGAISAAPSYGAQLLAGAVAMTLPPAERGGLCVTGSRRDPLGRHSSGWLILVTVRGEDGAFTQVAMTPAEARRQAAELIDKADVLEGIVW